MSCITITPTAMPASPTQYQVSTGQFVLLGRISACSNQRLGGVTHIASHIGSHIGSAILGLFFSFVDPAMNFRAAGDTGDAGLGLGLHERHGVRTLGLHGRHGVRVRAA